MPLAIHQLPYTRASKVVKMCSKPLLLGSLIILVCASGLVLNAAQITGGISLSGSVTFYSGDINTATGFQSFDGVTVASASGSYASAGVAAGTHVNMTAFMFSPFLPTGVLPLWQTTDSPSASFNLAALTSVWQPGDDTLALRGCGTLFLAGYDPTPGAWIFTAQGLSGTFSFSSSNGAVPDGGCTMLLLGIGFLSVAALRRQLA